jgi:FkbM family methyltransferase
MVNLRKIHNDTLAGLDRGCKHRSQYFVTKNNQFPMCMGQTDQDLKNGMSIINLVNSRGCLPTCRILHLLLWMSSEVHEKSQLMRDYFVDVGANIGSCTVHMASLGFPVISIEPVPQHIDTIQGSIDINPSFNIELHHMGMSAVNRHIKANFGHGARNWGASEFHEVSTNTSFEIELPLRSLDTVLGNRKVALMKVDCEGCEWETLKG